ncbi:hypothetical protein H310_04249 [Aphanomyces invadans]|uniref:PH domain-containing protein n=1 Tax=Aphanomyces invadans TaxID=157072 RepID=A0A024UFX2_9STRA|nr:hypothetical protein H310_04249 [Aphanomyces invadans]ETW05296.1 hypothetical protein H310_04249 [Aphanomyces invadans]|eukprot:XP_008866734.1 hypothetical protein H310_04249 [Aphanomyces invadans]
MSPPEDKKTPLVGGHEPSEDASVSMSYQTEELRGYLLKKTRNGKWQKRWFETNGCFLTYYKKQGQKLLAALNLPQVGEIVTLPEDTEDGPGLFSIELNERIYTIKAKHQEEAALWVEALVWRQKGGVVAQANGDDALFLHAAASTGDDADLSPKAPTVQPPQPLPPKTKEVEETQDVRRCGCGCAIQ